MMRARRARVAALLVAAIVVSVLAGGGIASASAGVRVSAAARARWGRAEMVPGLAALNKGYNASVNALSCGTPGNCAAAGFYTDKYHHSQAWVALERKGRWGTAIEVPGTAALNAGGSAAISSVSCGRGGTCAAVGTYTDDAGNKQWFVVGESRDRWGKAATVPVPALASAAISTVWCAPGMCAAGGTFTDSSTTVQPWVMTQTGGRWHTAIEVPGIAALNVPGSPAASLSTIACASPGNCAAGGSYVFMGNISYDYASAPWAITAFVVTETKGVWGTAKQVPGIMNLNQGWQAETTMMSCPAAGDCTAAGGYLPASVGSVEECYPWEGCHAIFTLNEHDGVWRAARNSPLQLDLNALACSGVGDCALAGDSLASEIPWVFQAGIVTENNGTWGGLAQPDGAWTVNAVSCSSPGYCAAGGTINEGAGAYVVSEWRGAWSNVIVPAGIRASTGTVNAVACPPRVDRCIAGGSYPGPKGGQLAFVLGPTG